MHRARRNRNHARCGRRRFIRRLDVDRFDQLARERIVFRRAGPLLVGKLQRNFFTADIEKLIDGLPHVDVVTALVLKIAREGPGRRRQDILARPLRLFAHLEDAPLLQVLQVAQKRDVIQPAALGTLHHPPRLVFRHKKLVRAMAVKSNHDRPATIISGRRGKESDK